MTLRSPDPKPSKSSKRLPSLVTSWAERQWSKGSRFGRASLYWQPPVWLKMLCMKWVAAGVRNTSKQKKRDQFKWVGNLHSEIWTSYFGQKAPCTPSILRTGFGMHPKVFLRQRGLLVQFYLFHTFHHIPATLMHAVQGATIPLQLGAVPWRNTPGGPMTKRRLLGMQKVDQLRELRIPGFSWDESYGHMISSKKDNPNWEHNSTATVDHKERFSKVSFLNKYPIPHQPNEYGIHRMIRGIG